ncbi:MAG: biotin/lipoyl-binding protein [Candidatus Marinimicrobia bacterium]|nr:biotin/lipoyl-binding protein [Candidatus Neomarinimicrobiota bacterium]
MIKKTISIQVNEKKYDVTIENFQEDEATVTVNNKRFNVKFTYGEDEDVIKTISRYKPTSLTIPKQETTPLHKPKALEEFSKIKAPLPGLILKIFVREGDQVRIGEKLIVMEAMKMENEITSNTEGVVKRIHCREGDSVNEGDVLLIIE